jgi:cell wall-associated NlpC family hydrolase
VLAGFVIPLALVGSSRNARAGQAAAPRTLVIERDGAVAAPPLLAGGGAGPLPGGIGTDPPARVPPVRGHILVGLEAVTGGLQAVPGATAALGPDVTTASSGGLPIQLTLAIVAANRISRLPYIWGGGHGSFDAPGYDCSGSVSYVLHAALALATPEDSTGLESYGAPGPGQWITVYANASHAFMTLGGLRYDTIGLSSTGSRWQPLGAIPAGYVERHPIGL